MFPRDRRKKLEGVVEGTDEDLVTLDVSRAPECTHCGGALELTTEPMTGQTLEACQQCGTRHPVRRFLPVTEK